MATPTELGRTRYQQVTTVVRSVVERVQQVWRGVSAATVEDDLEGAAGAAIVAAVAEGQLTVADAAQAYIAAQMAAQGGSALAEATLAAAAFAGIAPDGGPLETLLFLPAIGVRRRIAAGLTPEEAMLGGLADMARYAATSVADTARSADQVAMTANPNCVAYVRVVQLPACSRCIVLSGRMYSRSEGFLRHPNCFPAGVAVSGPSARAATRRRYQGELAVITTASGKELPATGNHPVLTDRGWVPANLLQEGDHVVRSALAHGAVPLVVPHERQMPALIEEVWRPDGVRSLLQVPTSAEDFHGDGGHGDVDVVLADGFLRHRLESSLGKPLGELALTLGVVTAALLTREGAPLQLIQGALRAADGIVGRAGLGGTLLGSHLGSTHDASLRGPSALHAMLDEHALYGATANAEASGDRVLTLASQIGGDDVLLGERNPLPPRWDAPGLHRTAEDRRAYAERGLDLLRRLTGQVELDRVVEVRSVDFAGHVYNLTSTEGWYSANSLIVSNCDCQTLPLRAHEWPNVPTPAELAGRMSEAEQRRVFTAAGAEAIRSGADVGQVVNARRGMQTAHLAGRSLQVTSEGTTRRGLYGSRARRAGGEFARFPGQRYSRVTTPRLMPEEILRISDNRAEQLRLLRRYGYIV